MSRPTSIGLNQSSPTSVTLRETAVEINNIGAELLCSGWADRASETFCFALQCIDSKFYVPQLEAEAAAAVAKARSWRMEIQTGGNANTLAPLPASVYTTPIRIDPNNTGTAVGGSRSDETREREAAAVAFNYALSHHIIGYTDTVSPPEVRLARIRAALAIYQAANEAASGIGYVGLTQMVRALLGNMAEIHRRVLGQEDVADELVEEMKCVHEVSGSSGSAEGSTLDFFSLTAPEASPSA